MSQPVNLKAKARSKMLSTHNLTDRFKSSGCLPRSWVHLWSHEVQPDRNYLEKDLLRYYNALSFFKFPTYLSPRVKLRSVLSQFLPFQVHWSQTTQLSRCLRKKNKLKVGLNHQLSVKRLRFH